jgi:iron complex outermembrane receptor protein
MLDYTVGVFHSDFDVHNGVDNVTPVTFFGHLATIVHTPITTYGRQNETSVFGNVTFHLWDNTELSGGVRQILFQDGNEIGVSGATLFQNATTHAASVYNVSISHRFNSNFLVYANTGSSWREGPFVIGIFQPLTNGLAPFVNLQPETSTSYEVGFKSDFLDKRLRFDLAVFHQDFTNFIYRGPPVYYVSLSAAGFQPATFNFDANVPASINGFDLDAAFQVTRTWNVSGALSFARGQINNGVVACNNNLPATVTIAAIEASAGGNFVAACKTDQRLSDAPDWSLTLQSEYHRPLVTGIDGYIRGLLTYYPSNVNDPTNPYDNVPAYGLLNLYLGARSTDGKWEISLFGKNITDTGETLQKDDTVLATSVQALQPPTFRTTLGGQIPSSYVNAHYTAPREFGINLHYAFGSR